MKTGRSLPTCAATDCGPELVALDPTPPGKRRRVAIAGNPNTGKTTLFNRLTGLTAKVGNFPGVTVECRTGQLRLERTGALDLVDIPGAYSLTSRSREEEIAIQALLGTAGNERASSASFQSASSGVSSMACITGTSPRSAIRSQYLRIHRLSSDTP